MESDALVSTQWLAEHLLAPDVRVVDASWFLPAENREALAEYKAGHIPGAVFFDIDKIADPHTDLPHMLPDPVRFSSAVRKLGLGDGNRLVIYDRSGIRSAARVWWTFRYFGHRDVAVLDGGYGKWVAEGRPIEDIAPMPRERHFTPRLHAQLLRDFDQIKANLERKAEQVIDARPAGRFRGEDPEFRAGLKSGHIPGSFNVPSAGLLNADGTLLQGPALKAAFESAGVDLDRPMVTTCGSGITASVLALALYTLGRPNVGVYDGSWTEWGGRDDTPVATGA